MEAQLQITGGDAVEEYASLWEWLRSEPELRQHVDRVTAPVGPNELSGGGLISLLTVALGSGGFAAVLARSLVTWLGHRRRSVTLTLTAGDRAVKLDAANASRHQQDDAFALVRDFFTAQLATGNDGTPDPGTPAQP